MATTVANAQKISEHQFSELIRHKLSQQLRSGYVVHCGKSLLYKLEVDASGQLMPANIKNPTRGQYAFQTDVMIERRKPSIPLVVIELKQGGFTTHDIITYSAKASRHKDIYPYLRYGFLVEGLGALSRKFLTHNQGIDFAMALPDLDLIETDLIGLVKRQISTAEKLLEVMQTNRTKFSRYEKTITISV